MTSSEHDWKVSPTAHLEEYDVQGNPQSRAPGTVDATRDDHTDDAIARMLDAAQRALYENDVLKHYLQALRGLLESTLTVSDDASWPEIKQVLATNIGRLDARYEEVR